MAHFTLQLSVVRCVASTEINIILCSSSELSTFYWNSYFFPTNLAVKCITSGEFQHLFIFKKYYKHKHCQLNRQLPHNQWQCKLSKRQKNDPAILMKLKKTIIV